MTELTALHRYELAPERRVTDRRSGEAGQHAERRHGDRRRHHGPDARIRRVLPVAESPEAAGLNARERRQQRRLMLADALAAAAAILAAEIVAGAGVRPLAVVAGVAIAVLLAKLVGLEDRDHLTLRRSTLDEAPQLLQIASLAVLTYWLTLGAHLHRGAVAAMAAVLFGGLLATRAAGRVLSRRLDPPERCLFVGDRSVAEHIKHKIDCSRANASVVAALPLGAEDPGTTVGGVEGLRHLVQAEQIDRVVIAPVSTDAADTLELIRIAKQACTRVSLLPRLFEVVGSAVEFEDLDGMTLIGVRRFGLSPSARVVKRTFDIVVSAIALVVLAPLMLAIALAVRLDAKGPVFFRQTRVGRDGEHFEILKFRTMVPDAEGLKDALRDRNETEGLFKLADDPRITRVGRLLRRTSLDELPQLINVLKGEMSIVGPRPLVLDEDAQILGLDRGRLHLTPGMTGPWQVLRSGRVPMVEMVGLDYLYVANWSLWNDLKLMLRTVPYVLSRGGL